MNFFTALRKELLEQARTGRLVILGAVLLFFGLTSPLAARYTPEIIKMIPGGEAIGQVIPTPTLMDAVAQYIKNTNQFGVLLGLLLAMGMVAQEKERGTAAMVLVKPMSRGSFLMAKFTALSLTLLGGMLLAGLGAYYYTLVLFSAPDPLAWLSVTLLMWFQVLVYVALTLLFSTLVRSQAAAAGLGVGAIILLSLFGSIPALAIYNPGSLISWGATLFTPQPSPAWPALWVSLALIVASLVAGWLIFTRQEL